MVGWNVCPQHMMNLQCANKWIYSNPTVNELITAAMERLEVQGGERCPERRVAGDTWGTLGMGHHRDSAWHHF